VRGDVDIVERGGKAWLEPVLSRRTADFYPLVCGQVHPSAVLATDELPAYTAIGRLHAGHIRGERRRTSTAGQVS
jgi:hypothetical protein